MKNYNLFSYMYMPYEGIEQNVHCICHMKELNKMCIRLIFENHIVPISKNNDNLLKEEIKYLSY